MKKVLFSLVALTFVFVLAACPADDPDAPGDIDDPDIDPDDDDVLFVGTMEFSGEFINWGGASAYDIQIQDLINGYSTVSTDKDGEFVINETVIENVDEVEDTMAEEIDPDDPEPKTYTFEIRDDLEFSDGEPITAEDYAFGIKMQAAYSIAQAGHTSPTGGQELVGFDEFREGETTDFEGVEVVDDYTLELTIAEENLPYFYELASVSAGPQPKHVYTNDGEFDFLTAEEHDELGDDEDHIGEYIAQYIDNPPVNSGPYTFEHYEDDQFVRLEKNENFIGDFRGETPSIEDVVVRVVPSATDVEHLIQEEVHLLTGMVEADDINRALEEDHLVATNYDRPGFGGLYFHTDFGPTEDPLVRQAISHVVDREQFVETFLEGYAELIDAPLGLGLWMTQESDTIPDELYNYSPDLEQANELLDEAGWGYDSDGNELNEDGWDEDGWDGDDYRYNEDGEELYLGWMGTESEFSDILAVYMNEGMEEVGVDFYSTQAGFDVLIDNYYFGYDMPDEDRDFHMFNLATSYTPLHDPYLSYHSSTAPFDANPQNYVDSPEDPQFDDFEEQADFDWYDEDAEQPGLTTDELTERMRQLPAEDDEQFLEYWEALMMRLNRTLPVLPLYSNIEYNFHHEDLENVDIRGFWEWQDAIVDFEWADE